MFTALLILVALLLIVILAGSQARARLRRRYLAPGRMVDVGGYRLHLHTLGQGEPAVVFDAGLGATGLAWAPIQRIVAQYTRAIVYDRAGLGWSEPGRQPRNNATMVEELHELLRRAGIPGPYVLVGHSLGGLNARLFAHVYPQEVAGLILVDAVHEEQFTPAPIQKQMQSMARFMPLIYGLQRLFVWSGLPALRPALMQFAVKGVFGQGQVPAKIAEAFRALIAANPGHHAAVAAEMQAIGDSHAEVRARHLKSLGDIPLIVLSHGRVEESPMLDPDVARLAEETFGDCQLLMAGESSRGRQIVAEHSGHNILFEQPELILDAIREVVQTARDRGSQMIAVPGDGREAHVTSVRSLDQIPGSGSGGTNQVQILVNKNDRRQRNE